MKKAKTPLEAIRLKCKECSNGQKEEILNCPIKDCPLYPFRIELTQLESVDISVEPVKPEPQTEKPKPRIISFDEDLPIEDE